MAVRDALLAVEQQLVEDLEAITDAQTRALVQAWALAWSEISADLVDALTTVMADGTKVTAAAVVRSTRLAQQLAVVADRLDDLAVEAGVTITRDLADVVDQAVDGQIGLIHAQFENDDPRRTDVRRASTSRALDAMVSRLTERITSQTLPLGDETYEVIQRELVRGVAVGSNPRETARRMVNRAEDKWNFGLTRALTISRTELLDASREAAAAEQDEHADVLAGWLWLAHLGPRTCRSCLAMHGRLFTLVEPGPNDHQQGRCSRCPVVKGVDGGEPDLSWVPDADEHFASLDVEDQKAILGRDGYRAWAAGDFPRETWTKTRSNDGWRDSQVPAAPGESAGVPGDGRGSTPPPAPPPPSPPAPTPRPRRSLEEFIFEDGDPTDEEQVELFEAFRDEMDRDFGDLRAVLIGIEYEPWETHFEGEVHDLNGEHVGTYSRSIHQDSELWAEHHYLSIVRDSQGTGFARAFNDRLYDWYRESGFVRVELDANIDVGGYAWAAAGYDFAEEFDAMATLGRLEFEPVNSDEDQASVDDVLDRARRFPFGHDMYPTAYEFSQAGRLPHHVGRGASWPGKRAMIGLYKQWRGVLWL